jgi:hypothetical protein
MATEHVEITLETIKQALAKAALGDKGRDRWIDTQNKHLMLERRGKTVSWYLKDRNYTRKLGDVLKASYKAADQLTPSDARKEADRLFAELKKSSGGTRGSVWTWAQLIDNRLDAYSDDREKRGLIKIPSSHTQADIRNVFGIDRKTKKFVSSKRPSLSILQNKPLNKLDIEIVGNAMRAIEGRRPREKFLNYTKTFLSWAYSSVHQTGFKPAGPWWRELQPRELNRKEVNELKIQVAILKGRKMKFNVDHVGELLVHSEAFCANRVANEKISPGIRFGLWWCALTANRRGSTAHLERLNVSLTDLHNELPGWGTAFWDAGEMKGRRPFMIGVPPIGLRVINLAIADWQVLVSHSHSEHHTSKWVFASTRRVQRIGVSDDLDTDVSIHASSLGDYLHNLRGTKGLAKDRNGLYDPKKRKKDYLKDIPDFSLHTIRSAATNFLEKCKGLPPAASSAFLDHGHKADPNDPDSMSEVTEKFYLETQRMPLKIEAMKAWSDAVMDAYYKAGGKWPEPYPPPKPKYVRKTRA